MKLEIVLVIVLWMPVILVLVLVQMKAPLKINIVDEILLVKWWTFKNKKFVQTKFWWRFEPASLGSKTGTRTARLHGIEKWGYVTFVHIASTCRAHHLMMMMTMMTVVDPGRRRQLYNRFRWFFLHSLYEVCLPIQEYDAVVRAKVFLYMEKELFRFGPFLPKMWKNAAKFNCKQLAIGYETKLHSKI